MNDIYWEGMILAKQEAWEACEDCDGFCEGCVHTEFCSYYTQGGETFDDDLASIDKGTGMITGGDPDE